MRDFIKLIESAYHDPEAQLKADYADLHVGCGYIGGVHLGNRDDRSFKVFTRLATRPYQSMSDVHVTVFDVPMNQGVWKDKVEFDTPEVRAKLDAIREKLAQGKLFYINGFGPKS